MHFPLRRLLLLPAVALVALGTPVLAAETPEPLPVTTEEVPAAPAGQEVKAGWSSSPTPVDAQLVGVTWEGDPDAAFTVEVRATGGEWSTPAEVEGIGVEADEGTKDAVAAAKLPDHATEPLWVGNHADDVRVSLTSGEATNVKIAAVDSPPIPMPAGSAGASTGLLPQSGAERYLFAATLLVAAVSLGAIALGWSPWASRRVRRALAIVAMGAIAAACTPLVAPPLVAPPGNGSVAPNVFTRAQWGARPFSCAGGPEYAPALKFAVVHHTVNGNDYSPESVAQMVRGIQSYHMDANGFCDIAYHFLVDKYGGVWEGRAGGMDRPVIGGHAGGFNSGSTGVALLGDFRSIAPNQYMWSSLVSILRWRLSVGGVHPMASFTQTVAESPCNCQRWAPGTVVTIPVSLISHRDVDYTECPGDGMWNNLAELRNQVASGIVPTTTTTTTTTTPVGGSEATTTSTSEQPTTTSSTAPPVP